MLKAILESLITSMISRTSAQELILVVSFHFFFLLISPVAERPDVRISKVPALWKVQGKVFLPGPRRRFLILGRRQYLLPSRWEYFHKRPSILMHPCHNPARALQPCTLSSNMTTIVQPPPHERGITSLSTAETIVGDVERTFLIPELGADIPQTTVPADASASRKHPVREKTLDPITTSEFVPPDHKHRTLVLCFDGTGDKFDSDNSNIVQLFSLLKKDDRSKQMVYYQVWLDE